MAGIADALNPASAILSGIEGGIQLFSNLAKERRDRQELAKLKTPFYKIQDEYTQNKNLAESAAQGGLQVATKDYLTEQAQRGLGAGISGILQSGGNANDINKALSTYNTAIDRTSAEDAEQHIKNIQYFMSANKDLAGQKTTQWSLNEYKPYEQKLKQLTEDRAASEQNAYGGANTVIGSVGAAGTSLSNNALLNRLLNDTPTQPTNRGGTDGIENLPTSSGRTFDTTGNVTRTTGNPYITPFVASDAGNTSDVPNW